MKTISYLPETIHDPVSDLSAKMPGTAFNKAFNTDLSVWQWFELPEHRERLLRFAYAMEVSLQAGPPDAILNGLTIYFI
jgi:hypothetical protein